MIELGATLAAIAAGALVLSLRRTSALARRLALLAPVERAGTMRWRAASQADLRQSGLGIDAERLFAAKVAASLVGALASALASLILPLGPLVVVAAAYAGFVMPSAVVERRAATRRADADRAVSVLVERLEALVGAGRPPETALALLAKRPSGAPLLDDVLRRTDEAYALGAPLFRTLAAHARSDGLALCATLAEDLERARDLGTGSAGMIRERRDALRAAERARSLEAAAQVEGKLMLVLVLCYLPALVLLVVIPLFVGLLEGLTG